MTYTIISVLILMLFIYLIFFTNQGSDYSKKTNKELVFLWPHHQRNLERQKLAGHDAYEKAKRKTIGLVNEMIKRDLLEKDFTFDNESLNVVASEMFARHLDDIKHLARQNDSIALYQLGILLHLNGNFYTSQDHISRSANLGCVDSAYAYAWTYLDENYGVTKNYQEAIYWFKVADELGHPEAGEAINKLKLSITTEDLNSSLRKAKTWLKNKNFNQDYEEIADITVFNEVRNQDKHSDLKKLTLNEIVLLAENGDNDSQYHLADIYWRGDGVKRDFSEALKWYILAGESGWYMMKLGRIDIPNDLLPDKKDYWEGLFKIGLIYLAEHRAKKDEVEAVKWFITAANEGYGKAQYNCGVAYFTGKGVAKDFVQAHKWAILAKARSYENSNKLFDLTAEKLTQHQIVESQKLADHVERNLISMENREQEIYQ